MSVIAVLNRSSLPDDDVAFAAAACDIQLRDHFLPLWPHLSYTPVQFFASEKDLPLASDLARLMVVSDTIDLDGVLGYHSADPLVRGIVLSQGSAHLMCPTLSHEVLEMAADPMVTLWRKRPDGVYVALEVCDPCQAVTYPIMVNIFGDMRTMFVSDFVTPAWFGDDTAGRMTYWTGGISKPWELAPGGYVICRDGNNGRVYNEFAAPDPAAWATTRARKVLNSTSRSYRRGLR